MSQKRPHIIIFNPDEMRADALHHLGKNQAAVTPNLDKFVQSDAVSFENAFCQNPVCVPSRCSFFTGLYPHTTGHRTMTYLLRPGETSMFKELKDAGYYVWMNNRNDLYAGQYSGWMESNADEIFYPEEGSRAPKAMNENQRGEEGGKYYYSHYEGQLNVDENGKNYTSDDETIDAAIDKIKNWKDEKQPLCMFLGLFYPHPPYQVEEPYFSAIDRSKLPDRIRFEDCIDKSKMLKQYHEYQNLEGLNEDEWDEIRATYAGMCMKVDEQFGKLVQALKDVGIYDDRAIFVDCLTKVPFLVNLQRIYQLTQVFRILWLSLWISMRPLWTSQRLYHLMSILEEAYVELLLIEANRFVNLVAAKVEDVKENCSVTNIISQEVEQHSQRMFTGQRRWHRQMMRHMPRLRCCVLRASNM